MHFVVVLLKLKLSDIFG